MTIEIIKQLALGVVPPGVLALVLFALLWRRRDWSGTWRRSALTSLGMGLGFVPLAALIYGGLKFPPVAADQWMVPIAVLLALTGVVVALASSRAAALCFRVPLLVLFALVSAPWLARTMLNSSADPGPFKALLIIAGFVALSLSTLRASEKLHERLSGPLPVFLTLTLLGAMSQILILAYSGLKLGQGVGIFAAMLGAALVVSFFRPSLTLRGGALDLPVLASTTFFFQGFVRADTVPSALVYVVLVAISPWLALAPDVGPLARVKGWKGGLLRVVLASAPLLAALAMGKAATDADMGAY